GGAGNKFSEFTIEILHTGWFALSNPFVESIDVASLLSGISTQGGCVYTYNGGTWVTRTNGSILPGQGFFLNLSFLQGTYTQYKNATITLQNPSSTSSKAPSRDFLTVSVATDGYKVPVMFAQNDMATEGYDIYDANKMFGSGSVAEPYLVCNGIELCKEEVSSANYTATMNIKSYESRSVEIVADNIPEGYSLTLIDGAVEMEMREGGVYTTDIAEGENADRFKLLITKNNVSIADVAEAESIRVVNNNRSIRVYGGKSVRTEVYNALGQKVYETSDRVFDLNNVASGAYVLRVQDGKSVNSTKIVVE
ncbi:MAG: T9SS type A sorting domain-containing protein, partial [Bacteroidales bacterium]|nr:T9SS type A sorting domain-containing protein [Bacteroidales bacterium]